MKRRPPIFHQSEKSYQCGACSTASVLVWFGEDAPPIAPLYEALRHEGTPSSGDGLYISQLHSYFLRKDWIAISANTGGPLEVEWSDRYGREIEVGHNKKKHQRIATWRQISGMLGCGFICILSFATTANTTHFAVVYDAFVRRNVHWLRIACSSQGYYEIQAEHLFDNTGTSMVYVKRHDNELRITDEDCTSQGES